jgi:hypothetical protein
MVTRGDDFDEFVRGTSTRLLRTAVLLTGDRDRPAALTNRQAAQQADQQADQQAPPDAALVVDSDRVGLVDELNSHPRL